MKLATHFIRALLLLLISPTAPAADLSIENVTVVSPGRTPALTQQVLIRDGRIVSVDSIATTSASARRLNGRGKFLVPGLMDSHVHVSDAAGLPYASDDLDIAALRAAYLRQQPRSYLYFGVTQLLDPSSAPDAVATFEAQPQRPDLFRCGAAPVLNGYPALFADKAVRHRLWPNWIFEPANAKQHPLPSRETADSHTPEAVVAAFAASGRRCVKVFLEDGSGAANDWPNDWPVISMASLQRVVRAAHERGLLVMAHANTLEMQRMAVAAGADVLAHGLWNWDASSGAAGMPAPVAEHLRSVRNRSLGFQPTLRVLYALSDLFRHDTLKDPMYTKVVPPAVLAWYSTPAGQWYGKELQREYGNAPGVSIMHHQLKAAEHGMRAVRYLHELGHPLLLASDTPSAPTYGNQPGYDTYREMRLMAQSGVSLAAIFHAGTINNARRFGLAQDYGSIERGKIANLLLLDANPLETVRAWSMIHTVVLHGEPIARETLAADQ